MTRCVAVRTTSRDFRAQTRALQSETPAKPTGPIGRKKREGDNFLEQLKRFLPFPSAPMHAHAGLASILTV